MAGKIRSPTPKHQGSKWTSAALLANPFDRFDLGEGVCGWVYEYFNRTPIPISALVSGGLEVAVQLQGDWWVDVWGSERLVAQKGDVFLVPPYQCHTYRFRTYSRGVQVGFAVYGHERTDAWRVLTCSRLRLNSRAARVRELAHAVVAWRSRGAELDTVALRKELLETLGGHCEVPKTSKSQRARQLLADTADRPLYLAHVADEVGLHPKALTRRLQREVGMTPIRFRTHVRLQRAIRLLWSQPDRSIASIASQVGIEDSRHFHRLVRATFGLSAAQLGRRSISTLPDR